MQRCLLVNVCYLFVCVVVPLTGRQPASGFKLIQLHVSEDQSQQPASLDWSPVTLDTYNDWDADRGDTMDNMLNGRGGWRWRVGREGCMYVSLIVFECTGKVWVLTPLQIQQHLIFKRLKVVQCILFSHSFIQQHLTFLGGE